MNCEPTADRLSGIESQILGTIRTAVPCSARRRVAIACRIFTNLQFRGEFFQQLGKRAERILRRRINPLRIFIHNITVTSSVFPLRESRSCSYFGAPLIEGRSTQATIVVKITPEPQKSGCRRRLCRSEKCTGDRNHKIDTGGGI
jgi:hypothetical protein